MAAHAVHAVGPAGSGLAHLSVGGEGGGLFVAAPGAGAVLTESEEKGDELVEVANTEGTPVAVAFNPKGSMYVADLAHGAVMNWADDGAPHLVVREYEGTAFKGPSALLFDTNGTLYFTDSGPLGEGGLSDPSGSVFCISGPADAQILRPLALNCLAHPCGLAVSPDQSVLYVCEMMANRLLRFAQRPAGVFHPSVFVQFSGRMGPSAVVCDHARGGLLYVARYDLSDCATDGVVSVVDTDGKVVKEVSVPGAEVSGLAIGPEGDVLFVSEASTNTVYRIPLPLVDDA
mmetsp:Transcript_18345/g.42965  ORF Transcript_18345/g.42965 Transcript_18345/m.42965 type:complete len:288 (+) Transcript_18345:93-956(+)